MPVPKTEDEIINSIPGIEDDDATTTTGADDATTNTTEDDGGSQTTQQTSKTTSQQQGDSGGRQPNATGKQQQQQQQPAKPGAANTGDLVDRQGNVIAKAGAERRHYEAAQRATRDLQTARQAVQAKDTELATLRGQVQAYQSASNAPHSLGLNPQEAVAAARMFAQFKADPVKTLKFLLGEVQAMGHNVEGLSDPNVQMHSIGAMIDQKLKPFTDQHAQARQVQQAQDETTRQVGEFYGKYPDAEVHDNAIGALCARDPTLSPGEAYWMLRNHFVQNGLDWNIPLETHNQRRATGAQGGQQQQQTTQRTLPNGRGGTTIQQQQRNGQQQPPLANEDDSWENIIRGSMQDAGLRAR